MADIYRDAMLGICDRIAMQSIRKIIRGNGSDKEKLQEIICVVEEYKQDMKKEEK